MEKWQEAKKRFNCQVLNRHYGLLLLLAVMMEVALVSLHGTRQNPPHVVEFITAYLVASLSYLVSCYLVINKNQAYLGRAGVRFIWSMAILFRLTMLPLDLQLSEDLHRYRWNGMLQVAGGNPYTAAPESPSWSHIQDESYRSIPGKQLPTVYGPVLEMVYAATYTITASVTDDPVRQAWFFKIPFALIELMVGWALVGLLRVLNRPPSWLLIYLWSPLIIVEFWGQGHNDPLVMLFVVLALSAAVSCRWHRAWNWLSVAVLTKLWPLLLVPLFILHGTVRRLFWSKTTFSILALVSLLLAPYWDGIANWGATLSVFTDGRQNNAGIYAVILAISGDDYRLTTAVTIVLLLAMLLVLVTLRWGIVQGSMAAVVVMLLLSANCFPWYLGWLVPFIAIYPNIGLLLWTTLIVLSYHVLIDYTVLGIWHDSFELRLLQYLPVYAMLLWSTCRLKYRVRERLEKST
ncbi:MAG: hypothetical protein CMN58_00915 [Solibacterales bacterium]|nr:hypothetical protein [Bryobacterales bacterium]